MFHFYSLLQPAELVNGVFTCYSEDSFTGVHMWSVTSGSAAVRTDRGVRISLLVKDKQSVASVHVSRGSSTANIFTAAIFRHMFKHSNKTTHRHEDSKLT